MRRGCGISIRRRGILICRDLSSLPQILAKGLREQLRSLETVTLAVRFRFVEQSSFECYEHLRSAFSDDGSAAATLDRAERTEHGGPFGARGLYGLRIRLRRVE